MHKTKSEPPATEPVIVGKYVSDFAAGVDLQTVTTRVIDIAADGTVKLTRAAPGKSNTPSTKIGTWKSDGSRVTMTFDAIVGTTKFNDLDKEVIEAQVADDGLRLINSHEGNFKRVP